MGLFPFPPIENDWKWLYQLLPINYESKWPSELMPGLYVIQIQIQAVWPVSQKKLQESKAEEETRYVKESHGIVLFFTNFRSKRAATGKLLESTTMSAVWKGFILSSWANSNDLCSEYFSLCQFSSKSDFLYELMWTHEHIIWINKNNQSYCFQISFMYLWNSRLTCPESFVNMLKLGLSEKHTKICAMFLMLCTFT